MRLRAIPFLFLAAASPALAQERASLYHLPAAEAPPGAPFAVEARIDRAWETSLVLVYRTIGDPTWRSEEFQRGAAEGSYLATVPPDHVKPPGIEYFIEGTSKGGERSAHFASNADPHRVVVPEDADAVLRTEELARVHGRRARVRIAGEWVDYGSREIQGRSIPDRYYRVEADFTYRLLRFPIYQIRVGGARLLGDTPATERGEDMCDPAQEDQVGSCQGEAGFAGGGWFEIRLRATPLVDVDLRGILAATKTAFNLGGRAEIRIGPEMGSHLALGLEVLPEAGFSAFVRLGWDTVPRLPMAATIEITDYPAEHRATAVRLLYDVAYPFDNGLRIGLRGGYQARDQGIGGPTVGGNVSFDF